MIDRELNIAEFNLTDVERRVLGASELPTNFPDWRAEEVLLRFEAQRESYECQADPGQYPEGFSNRITFVLSLDDVHV